jgi:hypothetical protein
MTKIYLNPKNEINSEKLSTKKLKYLKNPENIDLLRLIIQSHVFCYEWIYKFSLLLKNQ